ncbi:MAG: alpha-amylase [Spirochaetales bacterium]|nr:alpha-amylase [Spirochaetales bacterium]
MITVLPEELKPSLSLDSPVYEFHISARARKKYRFDASLFSSSGSILFTNFYQAKVFCHKMNSVRDILRNPDKAVRAGTINAAGLIEEIFHHLFRLYDRQYKKTHPVSVFTECIAYLKTCLSEKDLDKNLLAFIHEFPPQDVYQNTVQPQDYLNGTTKDVAHRDMLIEELIMLHLADINPAYSAFSELFETKHLKKTSSYSLLVGHIEHFFSEKPVFGPDAQTIIDMLKSPAAAYPHSVSDQLAYIRERWGMLLGPFLLRLLAGLDFLQEENKAHFQGPGEAAVLEFDGSDLEYERFSHDREWMPNVVLIAKNVLVWMDQLSKHYGKQIRMLHEIPDQELEVLARRGFNALWLIGLWERSRASKKIKHYCGNPDAEASAYSLTGYEIAQALGGWGSLENLRARCWHKGIRLASDMVPNHTGIDSEWVVNRPDYFLSSPYPPFPSYTFNGGNLSEHADVGIYLEDHYYDRSDAAVVFKRVDNRSGDTRYIYHGNDGTHMPWNDTAQLDYLKAEVREEVIQTILHVARNFPIIRFDAAMTLAKKHIQRLWYPEPGSGGDIPSRAEFSMQSRDFHKALPTEFWREVVDRVAEEVPDTLLLAEAFWMMEGYFVRTLGMHRVYNSAFMNMLKNEENQKYRQTIKNTITFDPQILKRFVNFMNNPDEDTAVAQFGKSDKYFGVCTMMITMPGLPMFGHGQIEGLTEKYGMEFTRAYHDETPDEQLVQRHYHQIFPLCKQRYLFSGVEHFLLYDYYRNSGGVNENVFAYSNRAGNTSALVLYNNCFEKTEGWIRESLPFLSDRSAAQLKTALLGEGLGLHNDSRFFTIFKEHISGLEYIRSSKEVWDNGLFAALNGYQVQVFMKLYETEDDSERHYRALWEYLNGRGVPAIEQELRRMLLKPVNDAFVRCLDLSIIEGFSNLFFHQIKPSADFIEKLTAFYRQFIREASEQKHQREAQETIILNMMKTSHAIIDFAAANLKTDTKALGGYQGYLQRGMAMRPEAPAVLLCWTLLESIGLLFSEDYAQEASVMMDQWFLSDAVETTLKRQGIPTEHISTILALLRILISYQDWYSLDSPGYLIELLKDEEIQAYINVNRYNDVVWFNKDRFEDLLWWLFMIAAIRITEEKASSAAADLVFSHIRQWLKAEQESEFRFEVLLDAIT